ncbi:sensor domain-containing protein [Niallia endozanthoxylica]|nr:EAL domain-containing protein [Niallia endozanthoxylica]
MLNFFEDQDYKELIQSLRHASLKISGGLEENSTEIIDEIKRVLNQFSTLKYAIDQSIIVAVTNASGQILYVNDKFCEISKYNRKELIGKTHKIINSGYHDQSFIKQMWDTIKRGEIWEGNIKNKAKDGMYYWVKTTIVPFCDDDNKPYMYIALRTDITAGKENEEKLVNALKNDFNLVVSSMHNFVFKVTKNHAGHFVYQFGEGKLAQQLGLETHLVYQKTPKELFSNRIASLLEENYEKAYTGQTVTYTYSYRNHHILTTLSPVYENGKITNIIGCSNDISELHRAKEEVEFLAYHDTLTNLPNRRKLIEDINQLIEKKQKFAFLLLDLDQFKNINDSFGHTFGDQLLKTIATRLQQVIGPNDYIYRFAGDEFIVLFPERLDEGVLIKAAEKLLSVFHEKVQFSSTVGLFITGSIGISLFPDHGLDIDQLMKNADFAMYAAKKQRRNAYKIFDQDMMEAKQDYLQIEAYLQTAIENDEFELYFQPKLDLKTNKISGMEALLRWHHPILGNVPPNKFIPIAEETGVIWKIDKWVLKNACIQNKKWAESKMAQQLRVSVNISPIQFSHPDFTEMVKHVLEETGLEPGLLELEITETTVIDNTEECIKNVETLRELGVGVSIDDFGTGYSSLNYLKRFPFDYLKIDQSYVREMFNRKEDMAIVKAIITLAKDLNLKVIAEGVEDSDILECLKDLDCDEIQGYYISRPLSSPDFETMMKLMKRQEELRLLKNTL